MCMKYVNATISCYESIDLTNESAVKSFNNPIDVIDCDVNNIISNLSMVTQISIRDTLKEAEFNNNILHQNGAIDIIIRLTKCDADENKRLYVDLDSFTVDLAQERKNGNVKKACFDYFNLTRITKIDEVHLPSERGYYVLKVLVSKSGQNNFSIQSMSSLRVKTENEI